jgi:hypothetical protein
MIAAREYIFENGVDVVLENSSLSSEGVYCAVGLFKPTNEDYEYPFPNSPVFLPGVNIEKKTDVKKVCVNVFGASGKIVKRISYKQPYIQNYLIKIYGEEFFT